MSNWRYKYVVFALVAFCIATSELQAGDQPKAAAIVRLSELRAGTMASEEVCAVIFSDGTYRAEKVSRRRGDTDLLRIAEDRVSEQALNQLKEILEAPAFRELTPPRVTRRLADDNVHALSVTVLRKAGLQELNYPTKDSRKGSSQQLKPLLEWWQRLRKNPGKVFDSQQRTRCVPR